MRVNKYSPPKIAVILGGGQGTRLRPIVSDVPKPMAPLNGLPFLHHLMMYWVGQGIEEFIISVGYMADKIVDYFGCSFLGCKVSYVNELEPLGTGGALLKSVRECQIDSPFILLNGDTYFGISLTDLVEYAEYVSADICLSLFRSSGDKRFSAIRRNNQFLIEFCDPFENQTPSLDIYANGGVYWINPQILNIAKYDRNISFEHELLPRMMEDLDLRICGLFFDAEFVDIGVPQDYIRSQLMQAFRLKKEFNEN